MAHKTLFTITLVLLTILAACTGNETAATTNTPAPIDLAAETETVTVTGGRYTNVTTDGLATMLTTKDFPLINVHIPYAGEIEGTDAHIPFDQISQHLDQLPADKSSRIVLYCQSGRMSAIAAEELVSLGYSDVWNHVGGMADWKQSGHPLND